MFKTKSRIVLVLSLILGLFTVGVTPASGNTGDDPFREYLTGKAPTIVRDLGEEIIGNVRVRRVVFQSRIVQTDQGARPSEIFAVIASPVASGNYPGITVYHGGSGSAEVQKAIAWAERGYIAVAPDLPSIANPNAVPNSSGPWKDEPYGGGRFRVQPEVTNSTIFDAVLAGVQAVYLLRSQPGVITSRIGVVGISWGGYMTTMVSGLLGNDVDAALSLYGSGFYEKGTAYMHELNRLAPADREVWLRYLDAGRRADGITARFFEAAATNDQFFFPPAVEETLATIRQPLVNQVFAPNANHKLPIPGGTIGTINGTWLAMEPAYFDYFLKGVGAPVHRVTARTPARAGCDGIEVEFRTSGVLQIQNAEVYFSLPASSWLQRQWIRVPAEQITPGRYGAVIPSGQIPAGTTQLDWIGYATDARPITASTQINSVVLADLVPASREGCEA